MTTPANPPVFDVSLPVEGPIAADEFFSVRPRAQGLPPTRRIVFGSARVGSATSPEEIDAAVDVLHAAWRNGFLLLDTAPKYGDSELVVGEALRRWRGAEPILCTKCGHVPPNDIRYDRQGLLERVERSRERLAGRPIAGLAIHEPDLCPPEQAAEAATTVSELVERGEIQAAGLGGGGHEGQGRMLGHGRFQYMLTFLRLGAVSLQALTDQVPQAKEHGVQVWAASPLFFGLLGDRFRGAQIDPPIQIDPIVIERAKRIKKLAGEVGVPMSQLALRFLLSMPMVDAVVSGAASVEQWEDIHAAYNAGPLTTDMYQAVWEIAQTGEEVGRGG